MNPLMVVAFSALSAVASPDQAPGVRGDDTLVTSAGSTTARTLKERFGDERNVKDFGAKGDGVADDTLAIQAALDSADEAGTKHGIYFPSGTY
jgi:polygalacturonase